MIYLAYNHIFIFIAIPKQHTNFYFMRSVVISLIFVSKKKKTLDKRQSRMTVFTLTKYFVFRALGLGLGSTMARVGGMISPYAALFVSVIYYWLF